MTTDLANIYDEFAATYDKNCGQFDMSEVLDAFFMCLGSKSGNILDLGCGAGEPFATAFLQHGWSVVGVDSSARMLALARQYAPGIQTVLGDMRQVEFPA